MADGVSCAGITSRLIEFIDEPDYVALDRSVQEEAVRAWVNCIGCMLGGAQHRLVDVAHEALIEFAGPPTAILLGRGMRADGLTASLINALAGAAYSFDDTYSDAMLHPAGPIISALIVLAQREVVDGTAFLSAFVAGIEVACRLTKAVALEPAKGEMGWSQTGIVCGMATALAAGKLLKLDRRALKSAIGIALSQAAGTRATHGSMAASLIFGHAAHTGLRAALMAAKGFTGPDDALEDRFGFLTLFAHQACPESLTNDLGTNFEFLNLTYKPFPCGMVIHPALDGVLQLRTAHNLDLSNVERITLTVSTQAIRFGWHPEPKDSLEAKVSLHHWVAVALQTGRAGLAEGSMEMIQNAQVLALRRRIDVIEDGSLRNDAADVAIMTNTGRAYRIAIDHCVGSTEQPMSDGQISRKFSEQAVTVLGESRTAHLLAQCWSLPESADVGSLIETGM